MFGFFSKKKKETAPEVQAKPQTNIPSKKQPVIQKDNDEAHDEELVNEAGKVGKAQHNFFRQAEKIESKNENRPISKAQLAEHKTTQSAWLSLQGTVYDVTNYIKYHPGGKIILKGCGIQCSQLFFKYHSWVNGSFILKKYKLGYLV